MHYCSCIHHRSVYREIQGVNKNEFDFREEQEPIDYVEAVCESMEVC